MKTAFVSPRQPQPLKLKGEAAPASPFPPKNKVPTASKLNLCHPIPAAPSTTMVPLPFSGGAPTGGEGARDVRQWFSSPRFSAAGPRLSAGAGVVPPAGAASLTGAVRCLYSSILR